MYNGLFTLINLQVILKPATKSTYSFISCLTIKYSELPLSVPVSTQ